MLSSTIAKLEFPSFHLFIMLKTQNKLTIFVRAQYATHLAYPVFKVAYQFISSYAPISSFIFT